MSGADTPEAVHQSTRILDGDTAPETTRTAATDPVHFAESVGQGIAISNYRRPELGPGHRFGRYVLGPGLGQGGAGTVFKAHDTLLDIPVALKLPRLDANSKLATSSNFLIEARTLARLNHPNLCRVFDYGEIGGQTFISMAFVDGERLKRVAEPQKTADLVRTIAVALDEAHAIGVIHRDLKPANVIVTNHGDPIVVDFGLAIRRWEQGDLSAIDRAIAGTVHYMSPEQLTGLNEALDARTDVYSLGVILYELLSGRRPFEADDVTSLLHKIVDPSMQVVPPSRCNSDIDPALEAICLRAIERDRAARFQTMREFASALEDYLSLGLRCAAQFHSDRVDFAFLPIGSTVVSAMQRQDQLYLDVGNQIAEGIIDHHARQAPRGSTSACLIAHPELVFAALKPWRKNEAIFKIILHECPDLDSVSAAFLAMHLLDQKALPTGAIELVEYVDAINVGLRGFSPANRYSLYAAYLLLSHRLALRNWPSRNALWHELVREGLRVIAYVLETSIRSRQPIDDVDAFATPGLLGPLDRREVDADIERYDAKLRSPATRARWAVLGFPDVAGRVIEVETLFVEDVQNQDDPGRCIFFKDWARSDRVRSRDGNGFGGLCVFAKDPSERKRYCTISVRPVTGASLCGLATLLDQEESEARRERYGVDDRVVELATRVPLLPRLGYQNADPWYDGRSHGYTIVDAPSRGTLLTVEQIESTILRFGSLVQG